MTGTPLTRRLFIAKAAPLVAATTMPAVAAAAPQLEPSEHMRAIVHHFAAQAPDGADRIRVEIGGMPEAFGYSAYAYISSWVPDARLRGGGLFRDEAIELARARF